MTLCLIVAVAENGVIGRDNDLPWRLSGDLKRFKAVTMGKPLIMGRRTFDSIGRPLPGRANIVLTRDADFSPEGVLVVHDPDAALEVAEQEAGRAGADEIMVIGGAGIYDLFLDRASRIYLTEVHDSPPTPGFRPSTPQYGVSAPANGTRRKAARPAITALSCWSVWPADRPRLCSISRRIPRHTLDLD